MKKKKVWIVALVVMSLIGGILYQLADRYLIEKVEVANASELFAEVVEAEEESTEGSTEEAENESTDESEEVTTDSIAYTDSIASTGSSDSTVSSASSASADSTSIEVKQVVVGSGSDTVTYYVADIQLGEGTDLKAAFADDAFGNNIIDYTSSIAQENNAIFAINGDYYGFREDGIIIRNGVIFRDEPARTGLAIYEDGHMEVYDETETSAEELLAAGVYHTLSFGPALVDDGEIVEGIDTVEVDTNFGNHSIQGSHPRTGIGMISENHYVFVVVDGRSKGYSRGVTVTEFAQIFEELGCTEAYNIDGGGSSTMYYNGELVNNPLGKNKERETSDILYISEQEVSYVYSDSGL